MKTRLFGVKKVYVTEQMNIDHPSSQYYDGETVRDMSLWQELHLVKPGSIKWEFSNVNGVSSCVTSLEFSVSDDIKLSGKRLFYMAETVHGTRMLVGLGENYLTVPVTEVTDAINDNPGNGCETSYKVTWNNTAGHIYAL